ncbi:hypothetical protein ACGFNU_11765 [Spirillospora sp. NPDC048911]|uniref:hypothetical protein n=1 Tax=Spirillospora sp. NPDC048911 TaxID=3364527 RepID=UPI00371F91C8
MRQKRSADPWSTFLTTSARGGGAPTSADRHISAAEPAPGRRRAPGGGDAADLPEGCRRVLNQLDAVNSPQTLEEIHHGTGLGLLEVAEAVEALRDRGLVAVEREVDEVVRRTGGSGPV